ncbi:MAG: NusG domain II-containing protein [Ruminococcaceae bacterium]|nr:NusG domain II-containing protein [Oscillospiraceae bacterium]
MEKKRRIFYDVLLISVLLCLSLCLLLVTFLTKRSGELVCVEVNGEAVAEYRLSEDGEYSLNGGTNLLKIENGEAYLTYADCPDKTCVKTGRIRYVGQSIVCLPNKVTVVVRGSGSGGVDLVS